MNNTAQSGAGVFIDCTIAKQCSNSITNSTFTDNQAKVQGAGIYYNLNRPAISDLTFASNIAPYGPNIASYPVKIVAQGTTNNKMELSNIPSGLVYSNSLNISIIDYDGQVMNLVSDDTVKITPISTNAKIQGNDFAKFDNGTAMINGIVFVSEAGNKNIKYAISSLAIDSNIIAAVFNSSSEYDNTLTVNFRDCQPGEILTSSKQCSKCDYGTYSFTWNSKKCKTCMSHATCPGETVIEADVGYWRKTTNSTMLIKCPNPKACIGGYLPDAEHPTECTPGYEGLICTGCQIINGTKYQPLSGNECAKCPDPLLNIIRVIGVILVAILFLSGIIFINVRKKKENQYSILMRILTNYIHLIAATMSFSVNVPTNFDSLFSQVDRVSSPKETFFSFD